MSQAKLEADVRQWDGLLESLIGGQPEDRAAIWGQTEQESNADAGAEEVKGSSHLGIGLIQWTGPRHTQLVEFAQAHQKPWQDIATQIRFIGQELNGPYKHIWDVIQHDAKTLRAKVETAMGRYEGPAGWQQEIANPGSTTAGLPRRLKGANWALAVIQQLKGKPMTDTSGVVTQPTPAASSSENVLADWIIKNEVPAETALRAIAVAKGVPGFAVDMVFQLVNPIINQAIQNLHPEDIAKLIMPHLLSGIQSLVSHVADKQKGLS